MFVNLAFTCACAQYKYDQDLRDCAAWLKSHGITTVAMESTGSYWQNLCDVLIESGFEVFLVAGRQTKNMEGKTDVKDCRWIQFLHTCTAYEVRGSVGLLTSSFLPDLETEELRTLYRHRDFLVKQAAKYTCALHEVRSINKMQKCLRLMLALCAAHVNFRLDVVLNDVTGKSGQAIIKATAYFVHSTSIILVLCTKYEYPESAILKSWLL